MGDIARGDYEVYTFEEFNNELSLLRLEIHKKEKEFVDEQLSHTSTGSYPVVYFKDDPQFSIWLNKKDPTLKVLFTYYLHEGSIVVESLSEKEKFAYKFTFPILMNRLENYAIRK